jgi:RNA polymerase sigma factor (sigma-70 family)
MPRIDDGIHRPRRINQLVISLYKWQNEYIIKNDVEPSEDEKIAFVLEKSEKDYVMGTETAKAVVNMTRAFMLDDVYTGSEYEYWEETIPDPKSVEVKTYMSELIRSDRLEQALKTLNDREYDVITSWYGFDGKKETLDSIGKRYGLTRERIRQILTETYPKLKSAILEKTI